MKIFQGEPFLGKINFVDENNCVVGYDINKDCCEYADWTFRDNDNEYDPNEIELVKTLEEMDSYYFSDSYFKHITGGNTLDEGGVVFF
jgi:hypothetical protein